MFKLVFKLYFIFVVTLTSYRCFLRFDIENILMLTAFSWLIHKVRPYSHVRGDFTRKIWLNFQHWKVFLSNDTATCLDMVSWSQAWQTQVVQIQVWTDQKQCDHMLLSERSLYKCIYCSLQATLFSTVWKYAKRKHSSTALFKIKAVYCKEYICM